MSWWESAYRSGHVPWDPGEYDGHLPAILDRYEIAPARVIDLGCGTGKSVNWLGRRGFEAVGVDSSPSAIDSARKDGAPTARFYCGRFPDEFEESEGDFANDSYGLAMERAFLQHLGHDAARAAAERIAELLAPGGIFYSLMIAAEGSQGHWGITKWGRSEIEHVVEGAFAIIEMRKVAFTPGQPGSVPAWLTVCSPAEDGQA